MTPGGKSPLPCEYRERSGPCDIFIVECPVWSFWCLKSAWASHREVQTYETVHLGAFFRTSKGLHPLPSFHVFSCGNFWMSVHRLEAECCRLQSLRYSLQLVESEKSQETSTSDTPRKVTWKFKNDHGASHQARIMWCCNAPHACTVLHKYRLLGRSASSSATWSQNHCKRLQSPKSQR